MMRMLAGMSIIVAMKTERGLIYALFSGTGRRSGWMILICIIIDVTAWMSPGWMFGGFFFFWAFPWDDRALRFKSSPKGCGLYSAIPNAWLKTLLAGVLLLHTASCVLVMLLLNCRFFSVRGWHVCSLVGWLCFRYSDVIIRIFGWRSCLAVLNGRCLIRTGINWDIFSWLYQVYFFPFSGMRQGL